MLQAAPLLLVSVALAVAQPTLDDLRGVFDRERGAIEATRNAGRRALSEQYATALEALAGRMQTAGDLEGLQAANAERDRFAGDATVRPSDLVREPRSVRRLQSDMAERLVAVEAARTDALVALANKYLKALNPLKIRLTRAGEMTAAAQVSRELSRVKGLPYVAAAHEAAAALPAPSVVSTSSEPEPAALAAMAPGLKAALVLWSPLDGGASHVGPAVEYLAVDGFVPGRAGKAAKVSGSDVRGIAAPWSTMDKAEEGSILFWMRVDRKPPTVGRGSAPIYDAVLGPLPLQYNANDGAGHGKWSLSSCDFAVYTEPFGAFKSTDLLGVVGKWTHYALVWNRRGIRGGAGRKLALFIDGASYGLYEGTDDHDGPVLDGPSHDRLFLHRNRNGFDGQMAYDELMIFKRELDVAEIRQVMKLGG